MECVVYRLNGPACGKPFAILEVGAQDAKEMLYVGRPFFFHDCLLCGYGRIVAFVITVW